MKPESNTRPIILSFCLCLVVMGATPLRGQTPIDSTVNFTRTTVMIPMRDGVKLHTVILVPAKQAEPLPILMVRTPYGVHDGPSLRYFNTPGGPYKELAAEGYIFAFQDIRGRYGSEGTFVMQRPLRDTSVAQSIDESTDAYDTVDWLVKNVAQNNGRVGVLGVSYPGWLTVMASIHPHPAVKAVSEQATPADMFLGDDFHHNGAFRLSYGFEYSFELETSKVDTSFPFDTYDTYEWYLKLGPLSNVDEKYFHGTRPTWENFVHHPNYDEFWKSQALAFQLDKPVVPTMNVAGWWDQEDFYGPVKTYETLEKKDTDHLNYLVAGPWNHGGWGYGDGTKLGKIDFGSATSTYYRENIQAPWFAYFLKDKGKNNFAEATTFRTGSNTWETYDQWPPRNRTTDKNLYFRAKGQLSFDPPPSGMKDDFDRYLSDPANPVPYRPRPVEPTYYFRGSGWRTWLLEDQRFVDHRPDVLSWETEPLQEDVIVTGDIITKLYVSTTGTDADWVVKLIDVYPEEYDKDPKMGGYELIVADEVFRGRFRNGFETPEPMVPGKPAEISVDIHHNDHAFLKGHRIMVQVQSTWFPVIDRNPQTFVPNIFNAKESDYRPATHTVYRSPRYPSRVILPVAKQ